MILYHGTTVDIEEIDLLKSARGKDFGCGFYLSADSEQAMQLAQFKAFLQNASPKVIAFEFDEKCLIDGTLSVKLFDDYTMEWAHFIYDNRMNSEKENLHDFDIVYGPIANDRVGIQVRELMEGNIDFETFLKKIKYNKGISFQYFFGTSKAIGHLRKL